ncbi:MAG: type II toxin-antitoxin system RelE/ParE family toxin [Opitutae bacterium]|nr:type II toxin-antitoxin system RelE/ParE family toxin [Opitutae bacterium]
MEIRTVVTLEEAAKDLDAGKAFYDFNEEGIGLYFIDSLLSDIESLRIRAGIHSRKFGFYRMLSKRFPFAVYYDIDGSIARVAAILDMRRDPAWIRKELEKRKG